MSPRPRRVVTVQPVLWFNLGFCAMISQVVFQRECISLFSGNELSIGVVLFIWLLFGGLGSLTVGKLTNRLEAGQRVLFQFWLLIGLSLLLPATLLALRFARPILGMEPGEIAGITPVFLTVVVCLAPLTFLQGGLFAVYCSISKVGDVRNLSGRASIVYAVEGAGAVLGGILMHFLLIGRVLPFATLLLLSGLNLACAYTALAHQAKRRIHAGLCYLLLAATLVCVFFSSRIELWSAGKAFGEMETLSVTDTKYGRIVLAKRYEQRTLFENGLLLYSYPNRLAAEEAVHIPMLSHPNPRSVLLLGGGCGGAISELLKHHPDSVDYVELDAKMVAISQRFLPADENEALTNSSVRIHYSDARSFVSNSRSLYDVIILNLPRPTNAQLNRFFTLEFFQKVHSRLNPDGLFAVQVPSSESYFSDEIKTFVCSIHKTMRPIFSKVLLTPGETAHLMATDSHHLELAPEVLVSRLFERGIQTDYVADWSIPPRFEPFRMDMIEAALEGCADSAARINRDFSPICYYYALVLWGKETNRKLTAAYEWLGSRTQHQIYLSVGSVLLAVLIIQHLLKRHKTVGVLVSLATIGFLEIGVEMILLIAYQTLFGNIYSMIGLLTCIYMAGIAGGAFLSRHRLSRSTDASIYCRLIIYQAIAVLYPIACVAVLFAVRSLASDALAQSLFAVIIFCGGAIGGVLYVYGNAAYTKVAGSASGKQLAGTTYFADLLGSSVGAMVVTSALLPILGVNSSLVFASLIALVGLCALGYASLRR